MGEGGKYQNTTRRKERSLKMKLIGVMKRKKHVALPLPYRLIEEETGTQ